MPAASSRIQSCQPHKRRRCANATRRCHNIRSMRPGEQVKLAAGWLIEQAGWKAASRPIRPLPCRNAMRWCLVNRGGATGAQLWGLAQAIQFDVADKFGVLLQPEPCIV